MYNISYGATAVTMTTAPIAAGFSFVQNLPLTGLIAFAYPTQIGIYNAVTMTSTNLIMAGDLSTMMPLSVTSITVVADSSAPQGYSILAVISGNLVYLSLAANPNASMRINQITLETGFTAYTLGAIQRLTTVAG